MNAAPTTPMMIAHREGILVFKCSRESISWAHASKLRWRRVSSMMLTSFLSLFKWSVTLSDPKVIFLSNSELEKYRELSKKIAKQCHKNTRGEVEVTEFGKKLLIERARLVAGATNKISLLRELMVEYHDKTHMLIYCGATKSFDFTNDASLTDEEGERQIVSVSKMLGHDLGMKVTHFTSAESATERERIKRQFAAADPYQAIVAIKCLDEGVNFLNDCRMVVGDDIPLVPVLHAAPSAAHFKDSSFADHIGTDVSFILQNTENR